MKLLLDTCTFLWFAQLPEKLPPKVASALTDPDNKLFLSAVSLWEILISHMRGKVLPLRVPDTPARYFVELRKRLEIESLPVYEAAAAQLTKLPDIHRDPFDRLLICQSIEHGLTLTTPDAHISRYPIRTLW